MIRGGGPSRCQRRRPPRPWRKGKDREMLADIVRRCEAIEECYEFMLAYAAQGLPSDRGSPSGGQIRECLGRVVRAISGLPEGCAVAVKEGGLEPAGRFEAFFSVL